MRILNSIALILLLLLAAGCDRRREQPAPTPPPVAAKPAGTIVAMGDSLTAGLGVAETEAYPALLAAKLTAQGLNYRVINAGISGETSSGARGRIRWVLSSQPDIVILETGANDGLRGLDPQLVEKNLDEMVATMQENHVTVILCGMEMVRNLGADYTTNFAAGYARVAKRRGVIFMPFFLTGVADEPGLNQADGLHPTAAGYVKIVDNLLPYVLAAIKSRKNSQ